MYRDIEFVCTGNNARSPIAEAVAFNMLIDMNLQTEVRVTSSGTFVDFIKKAGDGEIIDRIKPYLELAVSSGILNPSDRETFQRSPRSVLDKLVAYEEDMRKRFLSEERGITDYAHERKQIVIRPEAELILPVSADNLERVGSIYSAVRKKPKIQLLYDYSGTDIAEEGNWIKSYDVFLEGARKVAEAAEAAVRKAISD